MNTLRQHISNVRGSNKLLSSEVFISDRLIASMLRDVANTIVTQQTDKRKLWQSPNLFTPIQCLEMEKVPLSQCCEYTGDKSVARSKKKLPSIGEGTFGLAIQYVSGMDGMKKFIEVTPTRYANLLKLNLQTNNVYYWIQDDYLYVSNADTALVNMFAYFSEDVPNDLLFPGEDCNCLVEPDIKDLCANPLDKKFYFPANRATDIEAIVSDNLLRRFFNKPEQKTSDNQEGN